jgi:(1->4)-alpha-D-glucan 1-alpha-D-glucosylmutase
LTIPTSTYRIQFRNGMTFDRAAELVPYIKRLGISHLYASPIFTAAKGSTHGYDVANANEFEPELGGREGFERLSAALKQAGLGLILDIVPNHMAADLGNAWWRSIIEWGKDSRFQHYFDVNWERRLTLPFLGDDVDTVISGGDLGLALDREHGVLALAYFESFYPLHPSTYAQALSGIDLPLAQAMLQLAASAKAEAEEDFHAEMRKLATGEDADRLDAALKQRAEDKTFVKDLHEAQPYRLMSWRDAPRDLSYRRFFEITGLAGLRVEDEDVFEASHDLILELVQSGKVDGLRIDHVDGLTDPRGYLTRLRDAVGPDCYLVVEKILAHGESLPADWPVSGTTGYEFIAALSDVLVDPAGYRAFIKHYEETHGEPVDVAAETRKAKGLMVDVNFAGEVARLIDMANEIADGHADSGAPLKEEIQQALRELLIAFPVYRTYGSDMGLEPSDRQRLVDVMEVVKAGPNPPRPEALSFLARILVGDVDEDFDAEAAHFRSRFQQLTGPLMAKSLEDTLFFRINPLIALNEVGGEADGEPGGVERFHTEMQRRHAEQPEGLSGSSTHDTKRGEDARARLYALSEASDDWRSAFDAWREMNRTAVVNLKDGPAPEPDVEWLIYQALIGVWPQDLAADDTQGLEALEQRFIAYIEKSLREAKLRTSWNDQNGDYEKAVTGYASYLLGPDALAFRQDFVGTLTAIQSAGALNSVTQTLIKLAAPGIPDIYQGSEGLDLSLVDPDNRRMPDYASLSAGLDCACDPSDLAAWVDGRLKQRIISTLLPLRQSLPDLFRLGAYIPVEVTGEMAGHVVAFARRQGNDAIIIAAPRLMLSALSAEGLPKGDFWKDTQLGLHERLGARSYRDVMSDDIVQPGAVLELAALFADRPFAVLISA